jgi:hypothetical protein
VAQAVTPPAGDATVSGEPVGGEQRGSRPVLHAERLVTRSGKHSSVQAPQDAA